MIPRRRVSIPLRYLVPSVVIAIAVGGGAWAYLHSLHRIGRSTEREALAGIERRFTELQSTLEYLYSQGRIERVQREIGALAADPALLHAALFDEGGRVAAAARRETIGSTIDESLAQVLTATERVPVRGALERVRRSRQGETRTIAEGRLAVGCFPVSFGPAPGTLRPERVGALLIVVNLGPARGLADRLAGAVVIPMVGVLVALALALLVASHFAIARRLVRLTDAARRLAGGDLSARAGLRGRDELGAIGSAFDAMAEELTRTFAERERAVAALRESEERHRHIVESASDIIYRVDPHGTITYCNPVAARTMKVPLEEIVGRSWLDFVHPERRAEAERFYSIQLVKRLPVTYHEWPVCLGDGGERWLGASVQTLLDGERVVGFQSVASDVTERRALEQQLLHAQKMEAIGRLAGGVAHDFNNILQAMMGLTTVLQTRGADAERRNAIAAELAELAKRGATLTRQLLLFSRREVLKPERLDLNVMVEGAARMLRRLLRENIALAIALDPQRCPVEGDRGQLEQVLVNLAVNAAEAMPEGGTLTIRTGRQGGETVWLEVEDTGSGMSEGVRSRIFEPFFTTKSTGTGLGLSVVHGIVSRHGGHVEVRSETGTGSAFRVILPYHSTGELPAVGLEVPEPVPQPVHGEHILVVEDEGGARESLREILTLLGYRVLAVGSGEEAFATRGDSPFDLLLTDLLLPGVSGVEVALGLQSRWPTMRVVLMSGYTEDDVAKYAIGAGHVRFLQKPFDVDTLAREVRAALDEPA